MKKSLIVIGILIGIWSCKTPQNTSTSKNEVTTIDSDTLRIANDDIEYEVIIIEPGFNSWLMGRAKQRGYYNQFYLENRNRLLVLEWNNRVRQPTVYGNLYEMTIDYRPNIDYGYEVNYLLYNYFVYFQIQYKQQLTGFVTRI